METRKVKESFRINRTLRKLKELQNSIQNLNQFPVQTLAKYCQKAGISLVLDVGANIGQFGIDMRRYGFKGQIISFEPVSKTFQALTKTVKKNQPWQAIQLGLGSVESEQEINISGNAGLSSSLLPMDSIHLQNFPKSATVATEKINISTLDKQIESLGVDSTAILLKLDVQGYEAEVLKGAAKSLSKIQFCYLEVSLIPMYEDELTMLPMLNILADAGHQVIDVFRGIKSKDSALLQLDVLTRLVTR